MDNARREFFNSSANFYGAPLRVSRHPAVEVAGVLVTVYVNDDGQLVISADTDESALIRTPEMRTPMKVMINGDIVFEDKA